MNTTETFFQREIPNKHYHGDKVRKLLVTIGAVMLIMLPFFSAYIPYPTFLSLLFILVLNIIAGLTNPKLVITSFFDMAITIIGLLAFGYYSVDSYFKYTAGNTYFWINELLAILFLIALYYSIKSLRGFFIK